MILSAQSSQQKIAILASPHQLGQWIEERIAHEQRLKQEQDHKSKHLIYDAASDNLNLEKLSILDEKQNNPSNNKNLNKDSESEYDNSTSEHSSGSGARQKLINSKRKINNLLQISKQNSNNNQNTIEVEDIEEDIHNEFSHRVAEEAENQIDDKNNLDGDQSEEKGWFINQVGDVDHSGNESNIYGETGLYNYNVEEKDEGAVFDIDNEDNQSDKDQEDDDASSDLESDALHDHNSYNNQIQDENNNQSQDEDMVLDMDDEDSDEDDNNEDNDENDKDREDSTNSQEDDDKQKFEDKYNDHDDQDDAVEDDEDLDFDETNYQLDDKQHSWTIDELIRSSWFSLRDAKIKEITQSIFFMGSSKSTIHAMFKCTKLTTFPKYVLNALSKLGLGSYINEHLLDTMFLINRVFGSKSLCHPSDNRHLTREQKELVLTPMTILAIFIAESMLSDELAKGENRVDMLEDSHKAHVLSLHDKLSKARKQLKLQTTQNELFGLLNTLTVGEIRLAVALAQKTRGYRS